MCKINFIIAYFLSSQDQMRWFESKRDGDAKDITVKFYSVFLDLRLSEIYPLLRKADKK